MVLQIPKLNVNGNIKLVVFVAWAAYGVLPTLHWSIAMGGMDNPIVRMLLPRVLGMYVISGVAFVIYLSKIPERFCPDLAKTNIPRSSLRLNHLCRRQLSRFWATPEEVSSPFAIL
ncbi:hypothetical protein E2986_11382 [Frieseomelitta varia]|uniref:Uncharacterized protein n=1 Tax=Frieseomelitta varia TaxID=561572 RepID=A0A833RAU7_9HYME|nr:hypothetical protein E2986_11382 [Frieseomelitta varia]